MGKQVIEEDKLENVLGGMVVKADNRLSEYDPTRQWEVIHNNTGKCLGQYETQEQACWAAGRYKSGSDYDKMLVSVETVNDLRLHPQVF